jgi:osmotically-inducible protein OsmY
MNETSLITARPEIANIRSHNSRIDSEELADKIDAILKSQFGVSVCDLRVTMSDSGLILEGTVGSYHSKQLAQHVAAKVSGRMIAANKIHVC